MYNSFLIRSFADEHLGCLQHLAIVNCAPMNIGVHSFFWVDVSGTVTRRDMGGDKGGEGEGFIGTSIKDTWTKP